MKMLSISRDTVYLSQAAGKFEVEESGSAVMPKPDPTGVFENIHMVLLCFI